MEDKTDQSKKNKKALILGITLLLSIGGNLYLLKSGSDYKEESQELFSGLKQQYDDIDKLYDESMEMVDSYKSENTALSEDLEGKVSELKSLKQDIERLKRTVKDKAELARKLKAKYSKVLELNKELENRIDDLLVENKNLFDKNESLKDNVDSLNIEKTSLGEKVNTGSQLKAEYFTTAMYKKRSSGKFRETRLAKRTNKIEVSFALLDNPIANKEEKTVYLRIVAPTGKVLGNPIMGSDVFTVTSSDDEQKFSVKKVYTYTGEKQELTLSYLEEELRFESGEYKVEIYVDNYLAGTSVFSLK